MDKNKWLIREIDTWKKEALIDEATAGTLKERYIPKKNYNILLVLFSIIGSLLIGAGIILIGARNWYSFPIFVRTAIGFLPLIASQGVAVYVFYKKQGSLAWRESVAILNTAANFVAIALVGQIFHCYNDINTYVVICGLLSLPMIYILDAASPLIIYYATVITFGAMSEHTMLNLIIMLILFAGGAAYPFLKRRETDARLIYLSWITVIAALAAVITTGIITQMDIASFFIMLLALDGIPEKADMPFKIFGTLGVLVILSTMTYEEGWEFYSLFHTGESTRAYIIGFILTGLFLIVSIFFTIKEYNKDKLKFAFLSSLIFIVIMRYLWNFDIFELDEIMLILSNTLLICIGIGYILHGAKHTNFITANIGMVIICVKIVAWFFMSDIDFLWRGIVFFVLGVGFLLANLKIVRSKKKIGKGESV